jgi:hypothetical protein
MFGAALLPGVTVRQALNLDGMLHRKRGKGMCDRAGGRRDHPTGEPSPAITAAFALGGGGGLFIKSHADAPVSVDRPSPTLRSGGAGHDGCCVRVMGGGRNGPVGDESTRQPDGSWTRHERDITDEPSTTISSRMSGALNGGTCPRVVEYRWSDEYRAKNPPIQPDAPSPTVKAQWHKGEPNGCLAVDAPSHTISGESREPIQGWKSKGYVRRLTPLECLRLQSGPDDFAWPNKITKTAMYRVVGNGWASGMAAQMSAALAAADPGSRAVVDLFCGGGLGACGWHGRYWAYDVAREAVPA